MYQEHLNPSQFEAVKHLTKPALVVAGPGSGKTRVLTYRFAYLISNHQIDPQNILCVTFTNKAAQEMKQRINKLLNFEYPLSWLGTFHSVCVKILKSYGPYIGIAKNFVIYDNEDSIQIVKTAINDLNLDSKKVNPKAVWENISSAKNELIDENEYYKYAKTPFQKTTAQIYNLYQRYLKNHNALDFDDLLFETAKLFSSSEDILKKYQDKFQFIMVDEYQDTNKAQYQLIKMLSCQHQNLYVVGDMSQAIYSFRGADFRNIINFQKDFPNTKVYRLEQNYRSTQKILDVAKSIIKNNTTHIYLNLWTNKGQGKTPVYYTAQNEKDEALYICQKIISLKRPYRDFAILYRTNAQSRNFEETLIKNNISYRIFGGLKFYSRKEIKDILAYLRVINNPKDGASWERIINTPPRKIGNKTKEELKNKNWDLNEIIKKTNLPFDVWIKEAEQKTTLQIIDEVLEETDYINYLNDGSQEAISRMENIKELRSVATEFESLDAFLNNVTLIESSDKPETKYSNQNQDYVSLMTVHSAKGLEFPVVFLVGMEEGIFPHSQSLGELEQLEEERRLCYVAVTRAMDELYITNARIRTYFGDIQANEPSRFLSEIPDHLLDRQKSKNGYINDLPDAFKKQYFDDYLSKEEEKRLNYFSW